MGNGNYLPACILSWCKTWIKQIVANSEVCIHTSAVANKANQVLGLIKKLWQI